MDKELRELRERMETQARDQREEMSRFARASVVCVAWQYNNISPPVALPPHTSVPHRAESAHKRTMDDKRRAWDDELAAAEAEATQAQRRLEEKRRELEARLDKEEAAAIANERTSGKEALQKVPSSPRHLFQMGPLCY